MDRGFSAKCFVPRCTNTTTNNRDKVFVKVPTTLQQEWCRQLGLQRLSSTHLYCCEDHLNLQEDLQNYYEWKLMQRIPRLKPTAKLKTALPDDEEVRQTVKDVGCRQSKKQQLPRSNCNGMKIVKPVPRPLAKWRQVCVFPHSGQKGLAAHNKPMPQLESDPGWKPSEAITELQKLLLHVEVPSLRPIPDPTTENTQQQSKVKATESKAVRSLGKKLKRNIQEGNDSTPASEAITNPGGESPPSSRPKRACRKKAPVVELSDDDDDESSHEDDESSHEDDELSHYEDQDYSNALYSSEGYLQEPPEPWQDVENDSSSPLLNEDLVEVKEELHQEDKIEAPDPLASLACSDMEEDEPTTLEIEFTDVLIKEEKEELEDYKALYLKNKEEMIRLDTENKQLIEENQILKAKNENLISKIENILQKQEEISENEMKNNTIKDFAKQNPINTVLKKNKLLLQEIQQLAKKNTNLSARIQELTDSNRRLAATIEALTIDRKRLAATIEKLTIDNKTDDHGEVLIQKVKTLSEDRKLGGNKLLQRERHELTIDRHTADNIEDLGKETGKGKHKMSLQSTVESIHVKKKTVKRKRKT